jgi:hypothetical protein
MKYTPYESPFVREARKTALMRAQQKKQKLKTTASSSSPTSTAAITSTVYSFSRQAPASSPKKDVELSRQIARKPYWDSDCKKHTQNNKGLFDPSLKKIEIFKIRSAVGEGVRRGVRIAEMMDAEKELESEIQMEMEGVNEGKVSTPINNNQKVR